MTNTFNDIYKVFTNKIVLIAALGFFVDMFDLVLFSMVRIPSLNSLGIIEVQETVSVGMMLLNFQLAGLFAGGFLWGVIGDKKSRTSALLGSIFLYSSACLANAFVTSVPAYAVCRVLAGIGMAGELGVAITLVVETLPKELRGYGTMTVSVIGSLGAVASSLLGNILDWRIMFSVGGVLGLLLLLFRFSINDSNLFLETKKLKIPFGDLLFIFKNKERLGRFLRCVSLGLPIWFVFGLIVTFAPEIAKTMGLQIEMSTMTVVCMLTLTLGDFISATLSQIFAKRKTIMIACLMFGYLFLGLLFFASSREVLFYFFSSMLVFSVNFWTIFMTTTAEQFGTNIRCTVTTLVPNFVRGAPILMTEVYKLLSLKFSNTASFFILGMSIFTITLICLFLMKETGDNNMDFNET